MTTRKHYFMDTTGQLHIQTNSGGDNVHETRLVQSQARQNPSTERGQHDTMWSFWERGSQFSLRVWPLIDQRSSRRWPHIQECIGFSGFQNMEQSRCVGKSGWICEELGRRSDCQNTVKFRESTEKTKPQDSQRHSYGSKQTQSDDKGDPKQVMLELWWCRCLTVISKKCKGMRAVHTVRGWLLDVCCPDPVKSIEQHSY